MKSYSVGKFTIDHAKQVYSTEASLLELKPGSAPQEIGIIHRSGVISKFVFSHFEYDQEGDAVSFNYRGTGAAYDARAIIFND